MSSVFDSRYQDDKWDKLLASAFAANSKGRLGWTTYVGTAWDPATHDSTEPPRSGRGKAADLAHRRLKTDNESGAELEEKD